MDPEEHPKAYTGFDESFRWQPGLEGEPPERSDGPPLRWWEWMSPGAVLVGVLVAVAIGGGIYVGLNSSDGGSDVDPGTTTACREFTAAQDAADAGWSDAAIRHTKNMTAAMDGSDDYRLASEMAEWLSAAANLDSTTAQIHAAAIQVRCESLSGD